MRVFKGPRGRAIFQENLLRTLAYSDLFDYPLTSKELYRFLLVDQHIDFVFFKKNLAQINIVNDKIKRDGDFYFLKGRQDIVNLRKKRKEWSRKKMKIAEKVARRLSLIPWIKMVGVTGALAMENCNQDDDIDLMIITSPNCLWLTRLLIYLAAPFLGIIRRKPKDKIVKDKICFNLFLDENHLKINPRSFFFAHEICQVKPLLNKNMTYEKFIKENEWAGKFLPNALFLFNKRLRKMPNSSCSFFDLLSKYLLSGINRVIYFLQYFYMKPKMTCEKVSLYQAFFHPVNMQFKIEKMFQKKIASLGLDKNNNSF